MRKRPDTNILVLLVYGGLAAYGAWRLRGMLDTDLSVVPLLLAFFAVLAAIKLVFTLFLLIPFAIRHARARRTTGKGGTAGWADKKSIRKAGLLNSRGGFFAVLTLFGRALFLRIESSGLVLSPAGGGKTSCFIVPALAHNDMSMVVADLKSTLAPMTKKLREKKHGHTVHCLNPAGKYLETVGAPACYNPLQIVIDDWNNPEAHGRVLTDAQAIALQIYPEPPKPTENAYFRNASRKLIVFCIVYLVVMGLEATLANVFTLLQSRERLADALEMARSTDYLNGDLAGLAEDISTKLAKADPRQIESFFEGALGEMQIYAPSGPLAASTARCDFRFYDLREGKGTVYVMSDPTWQEVFNRWTGLIYWCAKTELLRAAGGEKVCFLIDEAANIRIEGLPSLLTLAREFNIIVWIVLQELEEWAAVYGRPSLETLLSQTEAKLIYGVRSHRTCQLVSDMLGDTSIVSQGHNIGVDVFDPVTRSLSEGTRRLLTPDEVRRFPEAIVFFRDMRPICGVRIGYHEVKPWSGAGWVGINPLFGKPYVGKTRLRLRYA